MLFPNFITFDDGLRYIHVSRVEFFAPILGGETTGTHVRLVGGLEFDISMPCEELAKRLGAVNAHW